MDLTDMTSFTWATVRSTGPLSVQLDGDSAPLALIPDTLVDPTLLTVGMRVRVELSLRKVVVHGVAGQTLLPVGTLATISAQIGSATDWNTYTTPGVYRVGMANWTGVLNGPTNAYSFGTLLVIASGNSVSQIYYPSQGSTPSHRTKWNASDWQAWTRAYTTAEVDSLIAARPISASGNVTANTTGTGTVTLPAGRFTSTPNIVATMRNYVANGQIIISARSTTSFTYVTFNVSTGTNLSGLFFDWIATQ